MLLFFVLAVPDQGQAQIIQDDVIELRISENGAIPGKSSFSLSFLAKGSQETPCRSLPKQSIGANGYIKLHLRDEKRGATVQVYDKQYGVLLFSASGLSAGCYLLSWQNLSSGAYAIRKN